MRDREESKTAAVRPLWGASGSAGTVLKQTSPRARGEAYISPLEQPGYAILSKLASLRHVGRIWVCKGPAARWLLLVGGEKKLPYPCKAPLVGKNRSGTAWSWARVGKKAKEKTTLLGRPFCHRFRELASKCPAKVAAMRTVKPAAVM